MSDPIIASTLATSAPAGGPPVEASAPNPAPAAAPGSESASPSFDPASLAYGTQLPKRLQTPEVYASLAKGGSKLEHLADGYLQATEQLKKFDGRVVIPGEGATPEDMKPVWKALGVPESPAGYKFDRTGDLEKVPSLPGLDEWYAELYHRNNLPAEVGQALWKESAKKSLEVMETVRAKREADAAQGVRDLEKLWGREAPVKRAALEQSARMFFGEEAWKTFQETPLANNAVFLDRLAGLQKAMVDSPIFTGGTASGKPQPASVRDALKEILSK